MNIGNIFSALGGGIGAGLGPAGLMGARNFSPMGMMGAGQSPLGMIGGPEGMDIEKLLEILGGGSSGGQFPNYLNMFGGG